MKKNIRDTTIAEAIFDVLEQAKKPLSASEIFNLLPHDRLVKNLTLREFWRHFGKFVKRKKIRVEKQKCPNETKVFRRKQYCYCFKKEN